MPRSSFFAIIRRFRVHVMDETGRVRPHVLAYLNDDKVTRLDRPDLPVSSGDELRVIQAVAGG